MTDQFTTREVALELRLSTRKVRQLAAELHLGYDAKGRAGFRYSRADIEAMKDSMRPAPPVEARRRRRRAS